MPIKSYSTTPSNNNASPPNGFPEGMAPASVNDGMRQVMADIRSWYEDPAWIDFGDTPTYTTGSSFTVGTDLTARYTVGSRIRLSGTLPFTLYGTITASSYSSPDTTITVSLDSGSLGATLSAISLNVVQTSISKLRIDELQTTGASGIAFKNSAGTAALTIGASGGLIANFAGAINVAGALGANGVININGTASSAGYITFAEDTDNGTNKITLIAPASIASDATVTLPSTSGTIALTSDIVASTISSTVATTSGTEQDIAISGVKQFTVNLSAVSLNATSQPCILLSSGATFETTGYASGVCSVGSIVGASVVTTSVPITTIGLPATASLHGSVEFTLVDASTNTWAYKGVIADTATSYVFSCAGTKSLAGAIDEIRLTTVAGTATFDTGKINLVGMY
jgi:hypothetical protein